LSDKTHRQGRQTTAEMTMGQQVTGQVGQTGHESFERWVTWVKKDDPLLCLDQGHLLQFTLHANDCCTKWN